jgi:hypothetical protein
LAPARRKIEREEERAAAGHVDELVSSTPLGHISQGREGAEERGRCSASRH